jgi:hypothetical protein
MYYVLYVVYLCPVSAKGRHFIVRAIVSILLLLTVSDNRYMIIS